MKVLETTQKPKALDVLKIKNFRQLWIGQLISNIGDSMTSLALLLLVNEITGSTTAIATMSIMLVLPQITIGLLAGVYVDRWDRRKIMIYSDLFRGLIVLLFILVVLTKQIWLIYVVAFVQATIGTFFLPARSAIIPNIVPEEQLISANSFSQTTRVITTVIGTGLGGYLVGQLDDYALVFLLDSLTFFVSMFFIMRIGYRKPASQTDFGNVNARMVFQQLKDGLKITFTNRILGGSVISLGVAMFGLGMVNILLVPLIVNELHISETYFAVIEFGQTVGMILGGILVSMIAARVKSTSFLVSGLIGTGLFVGLLSTSNNLIYIVAIIFGIGLAVAPANIGAQTIIQTSVPDKVRGRTGAANSALISSASILSMAVAGVLADLLGSRTVFVIGGVFTAVAGLIALFIFKGVTPIVEEIPDQAVAN